MEENDYKLGPLPRDLSGLTTPQLQEWRDRVEESLVSIKAQLEHAKADARASGKYSDHRWFVRATQAQRARGNEHQRVLRELAARRKVEAEAKNQQLAHVFMSEARAALEPGVFRKILEAAQSRVAHGVVAENPRYEP